MQSAKAELLAIPDRPLKPPVKRPKSSPPPGLTGGSTNSPKHFVDGRIKSGQGDKAGRWDDFFRTGPRLSEDFMTERDQGVAEEREPFC